MRSLDMELKPVATQKYGWWWGRCIYFSFYRICFSCRSY